MAYARTPRKLPTLLGADEIVRFLGAVPSLKARCDRLVQIEWPSAGPDTTLKLVRRQMYGRAKLDLLEVRLIAAAC